MNHTNTCYTHYIAVQYSPSSLLYTLDHVTQNYSHLLKFNSGLYSQCANCYITSISDTHTCIPYCTDLQLLEFTVYSLEESVLQTQSKIFDNQEQIFRRLCDLEKRTSVVCLQDSVSKHEGSRINVCMCNLFSMPPSPSLNWYMDDSDD